MCYVTVGYGVRLWCEVMRLCDILVVIGDLVNLRFEVKSINASCTKLQRCIRLGLTKSGQISSSQAECVGACLESQFGFHQVTDSLLL